MGLLRSGLEFCFLVVYERTTRNHLRFFGIVVLVHSLKNTIVEVFGSLCLPSTSSPSVLPLGATIVSSYSSKWLFSWGVGGGQCKHICIDLFLYTLVHHMF